MRSARRDADARLVGHGGRVRRIGRARRDGRVCGLTGAGRLPDLARIELRLLGTVAQAHGDRHPAGRVAQPDERAAGFGQLHHRARRDPQDLLERAEPAERRRHLVHELQRRVLLPKPLRLAPHHVVHLVRESFERLRQPVDVERELAVRALAAGRHPGREVPRAHPQRPGVEPGKRRVEVATDLAHGHERQHRGEREHREDHRERRAGAGRAAIPRHGRDGDDGQRREQGQHQGVDGARTEGRVVARPVVRGQDEPAEDGTRAFREVRSFGGFRTEVDHGRDRRHATSRPTAPFARSGRPVRGAFIRSAGGGGDRWG